MSRTAILVVVATALIAVPLHAQARSIRPMNNGPIVIDKVDCEKKRVQKCRWEGNRKICEWVVSTECEMY